jgi:hypothetical protein
MFLQFSAFCPLLGDHLLALPSCVGFHANEGVGVIGAPLRFGEFGFKDTQCPLEPSSYGTFISGFILEAPLYLSRVSQLFNVERLAVAQHLQITLKVCSSLFIACDKLSRRGLARRGIEQGECVEDFKAVL